MEKVIIKIDENLKINLFKLFKEDKIRLFSSKNDDKVKTIIVNGNIDNDLKNIMDAL